MSEPADPSLRPGRDTLSPAPARFLRRGAIHRWTVLAAVACAAGHAATARGGSVITANLPPHTAIVNISGTQDGAAAYNGDQSLWYHPFYTGGATQLLQYTVPPGTYSFRLVNPADAASLYPALTSGQLSQMFTAWTYNSPWITDYLVFDGSAATNTGVAQLFDGAFSNTNGTWFAYPDAGSAYAAAVTGGFSNLVRPGPPNGRNGLVFADTWTFTNTETLIFAVPDYYLGDNAGGVSVLISPAGPVAPALAIRPLGNAVALQWPTNDGNYDLERTETLSAPDWSVVTNPPAVVGTNFSVTLPVDSGAAFFRLHQP